MIVNSMPSIPVGQWWCEPMSQVPLGTVLAFTMAVTALSLPEMIILRKVLRPQLLAVFMAIMTAGIIAVGYLFNALMA